MATATKAKTKPMRITLSRPAEKYVRERAKEERYIHESNFVDDLIREDQGRREAKKRLEVLLLEGIHSGPGVALGSKEWKKFRERILSRVKSRQEKYAKNTKSRLPEKI